MSGYSTIFEKIAAHEVGHMMSLDHPSGDCSTQARQNSVMNTGCGVNDSMGNLPTAPTSCDNQVIDQTYCPPPPPDSPGSAPEACLQKDPMMSFFQYDQRFVECSNSGQQWDDPTCSCGQQPCPVLIDTSGSGFHLTSADQGVAFDLNADGTPEQISWTEAQSNNAFLVLDRNHNGRIDNGQELFGNFTQQPASAIPNGFLALGGYDKPENGGNNDGVIDSRDAIYPSLRLWRDLDHDGIASAHELSPLADLHVYSIALQYRESRRKDQYGNEFRYRAKINEGFNSASGRWAYDVFLVKQ